MYREFSDFKKLEDDYLLRLPVGQQLYYNFVSF